MKPTDDTKIYKPKKKSSAPPKDENLAYSSAQMKIYEINNKSQGK